MAKTVVDKKERKQLKVKWVGEPQPFGDGSRQLLRFNCEDSLQYEAFVYSLYPYIQEGAELDADTELRITTLDDDRQFSNWIVTQIYVDGEPVAKPATGARQRYTGRDEDRVDQRTFIMEVGADLRAGLEVPRDFREKRIIIMASWVTPRVSKGKGDMADDKPKTQARPVETPQQDDIPEIKNLGDLFRECWKLWKMNQSAVLKELGCNKEDIRDPMDAFLQIKATKEA